MDAPAPPPDARDLEPRAEVAVNLGEDEAFVPAVRPPVAGEHARLARIGQRLLDVEAETVLEAAGCVVRYDVRRLPGLLRDPDRVGVTPHASVVEVAEEPQHGAGASRHRGHFHGIALRLPEVAVERVSAGVGRHLEGGRPQRPARRDPGGGDADGVAAGVGRVVPGRVLEQRPVRELGRREPRAEVGAEAGQDEDGQQGGAHGACSVPT